MKKAIVIGLILFLGFIVYLRTKEQPKGVFGSLREKIICEFSNKVHGEWSETAKGVRTRINTDKKIIALTLDACGAKGDGYDALLINYLIENNVVATLFINSRWIDKNPGIFKQLALNPLFEIENHGFQHKPCSVSGKSIYGIQGTKNIGEVIDEIEKNGRKIQLLTGRKPKYYRSGTAYYDEIGVKIAGRLGYKVAGFSILGDRGATYSKERVREALLSVTPGSIVICHMNHPEKETAEGLIAAIPELKRRGFGFVKLEDYEQDI
jgi:peptidoglycan/xylan/chitin deacetylase (PgdA/CDA1 family)